MLVNPKFEEGVFQGDEGSKGAGMARDGPAARTMRSGQMRRPPSSFSSHAGMLCVYTASLSSPGRVGVMNLCTTNES
jgi:hypothetical protein